MIFSGCPVLRVADVGVKPGSSSSTRLTVTTRIAVEEAEDPIQDNGTQGGGQGVIGFWLPAGWKALEARVRAPGAADFERLAPVTGYDAAFPVSVPYVPGRWWPFVTSCQYVPQGVSEYEVELDIERPADARDGVVGIQIFEFEDEHRETQTTEVRLDLDAGTAAIVPPEPAPGGGNAGVPAVEASKVCPVRQVRPGPRGCSCDAVGASAAAGGFLQLLLAPPSY